MNARRSSRVEEEAMLSLTPRTKPETMLLHTAGSTCARPLQCQGYLRLGHVKCVDSRFENPEGLS